MNFKYFRKIVLATSILTFFSSAMHILFIIVTPSEKFSAGSGTSGEQKRNVLIRETFSLTSITGLLLSISLIIFYVIFNRRYPEDLPIIQDNSIDWLFFVSLALLFISPIFIIVMMYAFTIVMNLVFY